MVFGKPFPLTKHYPLLIVILLHLSLSLSYSLITPLGEAPDEPAHVSYAQFIANHGRLPTTLTERATAHYKSVWPPLYHFIIAVPFRLLKDEPPSRLKAVGDGPRRLIPTNGQTIASFIHTIDEAWPWQGLSLAWHLARIVSIVFGSATLVVTYFLIYQLSQNWHIAIVTTTIQALIPQLLFINGVVSDDNLLIFLSTLILLMLAYWYRRLLKQPHPTTETYQPTKRYLFSLGLVLGLATVTKYNALPLWLIVIAVTVYLAQGTESKLQTITKCFLWIGLGTLVTAGWWFGFVWWHFNQVDQLGWWLGSWAALTAGTADASLQQFGAHSITVPTLTAWPAWFRQLFQSFWGSFGGGNTINFPTWVYLLLLLFSIGSLGAISRHLFKKRSLQPLLLTPFIFAILPITRFLLSGNLVETAQGRHLFPAISIITFGLVLAIYNPQITHYKRQIITCILLFCCSLLGLSLIRHSYPPLIPLSTQPALIKAATPLELALTNSIILQGYEIGSTQEGLMPLTLVWQATNIPPEDYLVEIQLTQSATTGDEILVSHWLGHPLGGRYPTRAWDEGDTLRNRISMPIPPGMSGMGTVAVRLLNQTGKPITEFIPLTTTLSLPPTYITAHTASRLRADGLPNGNPFTYRNTISYAWVDEDEQFIPQLITPNGGVISATQAISETISPDETWHIVHFIVAADWVSGLYKFKTPDREYQFEIKNRPRQFEQPAGKTIIPMEANFDHTMTLLGYELPRRRLQVGDRFPLTLHWQAERTMGQNLVVFNHLLSTEAVRHGGADRIPQQYYTTLLWVPQEIVSDRYELPVETTAPPGIYWLHVGLYPDDKPGQSLPLINPTTGERLNQTSVRLGPLKVGPGPSNVITTSVIPQTVINKTFGNQITLLGYDKIASQLTLYWQAENLPSTDYNVFIHLLDEQNSLVAQVDGPPAAGSYPTSLWDVGEIIVDKRQLPTLPAGKYMIMVGLYQFNTGVRLPYDGGADGALPLLTLSY